MTIQNALFLAVILSGIILFGWQFFFGQSLPTKQVTQSDKKVTSSSDSEPSSVNKEIEQTKNKSQSLEKIKLNKFVLNSELVVLKAKSINSNKRLDEVFEETENKILFKFSSDRYFRPVRFSTIQENENTIKLSSEKLNGTATIGKNGFINYKFYGSEPFKIKFSLKTKPIEKSMTMSTSFALNAKDFDLVTVGDSEEGSGFLYWFGIDYDYHLFAYLFEKNKNQFAYRTLESNKLEVQSVESLNALNFKVLFVQKSYDDLLSYGDNLELAVDFGIWSIIALPILRGLQWFYSFFPNYGVSIILLTILIRFLTFPLQYKSFKSMKKMQVIQPELAKIKEKYTDDPQKIQQETMKLFKEAGANPLGGCLPLLAQMPIFFAFYQVLYSSVELVNAPFMLWIQDLSIKDPYYVLPVLMSLAMFLNQKITPMTTTDPMQKKLMTFMPLIFGLFMKDLPAGLCLYILVSTIVGMAQQLLVFKKSA